MDSLGQDSFSLEVVMWSLQEDEPSLTTTCIWWKS